MAAVADFEQIVAPSALVRENLRPVAILTADHEDRDLGSVAADVNRRLAGISLPEGAARELGGQYRAQQETFRELASVLAFGLLAVLAVLFAQFRHARFATRRPWVGPARGRRRATDAARDWRRAERILADGLRDARRPRRQERDPAARAG